ncbi:saccharopine dehydrogenase domain protein [Leptospira ryugenii]|uniref:Saccharopine dehydrogenase domain protein n=2 Tax=Leptospira ryugenii TaxID=1917863 RepID=A0A2P2E086_9LEPT|nr:saccharopine dehydrogenase domain protein [Leptospira ryugenii]
MLYGATGYSGNLIARYAVKENLQPILAGRSKDKLKSLAKELDLPYRAFSLEDQKSISEALSDCEFVFNAAGPFTETFEALLNVCLEQKIHNLSLVGEIPMLEKLYQKNPDFQSRQILCAIGLGYDVHPTDCLVHLCKDLLPDASSMILTMDGPNSMSPGSYKELIQQVGEEPFWVRRNGKLIASRPKTMFKSIQNRSRLISSIAWGDIASAYHSAGIQNIDVYSTISILDWISLKLLRAFRTILKFQMVKNITYSLVDHWVTGPGEIEREESVVYLHVRLKNHAGKEVIAAIEIPTSYKITYLSSIYAIKQMLTRKKIPIGYQTPAQWLGPSSILEIPGVRWVQSPTFL